jgi:hypothetical protein
MLSGLSSYLQQDAQNKRYDYVETDYNLNEFAKLLILIKLWASKFSDKVICSLLTTFVSFHDPFEFLIVDFVLLKLFF